MLKLLIKRLLLSVGIVVFKKSSRVYLEEDASYKIAASLIETSAPVIIDGGAHLGQAVDQFSKYVPDAQFHCFEPDPVSFGELVKIFHGNKRVSVIPAALGAASGRAVLNINASRPTNSLLPISDLLKESQLQQLSRLVERINVNITTIDEYCRNHDVGRIDIIKLDLQGYDYLALSGAREMLSQVRVVLIEVLFRELYQHCYRFSDIVGFLLERGFELYTLCGLHYGERGELLWSDAIFVRKDL